MSFLQLLNKVKRILLALLSLGCYGRSARRVERTERRLSESIKIIIEYSSSSDEAKADTITALSAVLGQLIASPMQQDRAELESDKIESDTITE